MRWEYTVMTQVGDEEPVASDWFHDTYEQADREVSKCWDRASYDREGITVRTSDEALAAAERLRVIKKTRYFVGKRQVSDWEECWS